MATSAHSSSTLRPATCSSPPVPPETPSSVRHARRSRDLARYRDRHPRIRRAVVQQPPALEPNEPFDERRAFLVLPRLLVRLARSQERRVSTREQLDRVVRIEERLPGGVRPRRHSRIAITTAVAGIV